jgi:AcrR family transcriptional regulator
MSAQMRSEDTRKRILQAAEESFARYGYDATGVAGICAKAKISKGAFYHHFPSKQALFLDLLDNWLKGLDESLAQARSEATNVPEGLKAMTTRIREIFRQGDRQLPIFLEFLNKASRDPSIWQATIAPYRRYHEYFAEIIKDGVAEGSIAPADPKQLAQIFVSLAIGVILQAILDPYGGDWERVLREAIDMVLGGLQSLRQNGGKTPTG